MSDGEPLAGGVPYPSEQSDDYEDMLNKYEFVEHNATSKRNYIYQEPHQLLLRNYISLPTIYTSVLLYNELGTGKCMTKDTPIIMHDGTIKKIQDIKVGEMVMGDDSKPRRVLSLARGVDNMYDIIPVKGEKYTVNEEHILCLKWTGAPTLKRNNGRYKVEWIQDNRFRSRTFTSVELANEWRMITKQKHEQVLEISVRDYLKLSTSKRNRLKGYRTSVEFEEKPVPDDPYTVGYKIATSGKRVIPDIYKYNSRMNRLKLMGGVIDAHGRASGKSFCVATHSFDNEVLVDDIIYVARSLGFACYKKDSKGTVRIYGGGIDEIPTLVPRKKASPRRQIKDVLVTGIRVEPVGRGDYYGFTLDGNCRYLIGDFTVTHNTCSAITLAEGFKEYIANMGRRVVVLVKNKNIQKNFMNELASQCTGDEYITETQRNLFFGTEVPSELNESRKSVVNRFQRAVSKTYQFITYGTFVNKVIGAKQYAKDEYGRNTTKLMFTESGEVMRKIIGAPITDLNNTVVIVDEAHNITNNDMYISLHKVLENSYNYRLVLLTATPMFDNVKEMFELSNLLNADDRDMQLPIRSELLRTEPPLVTREQSPVINSKVLKGGIVTITELGKAMLEKTLRGKVSYVKSNLETTPTKIEMGEDLVATKVGTLKVVPCQMSKYQYGIYLTALKSDIKENIDIDISSAIQNIESAENENEVVTVSKTGSLYKNSSDASTMTYPDKQYGKEGFLNLFEKTGSGAKYNITDPAVLTTDLARYSSKLAALLENVKTSPGNVFIFSNYVSFGGTSLLRQLFLANGYTEYHGRRGSTAGDNKVAFTVFDESTSAETRELHRRIFNSPQNKYGDIIKIIIGSPIISEGITLKNVRQVHILEPSWNMSRINQTVGRAVRNYSHHDLPEEERNVQIYKYVSVYYTDADTDADRRSRSVSNFFIDREKYILSEEKDRSNKRVERLLKINAFDCDLMRARNAHDSDGEADAGSASCDYTECSYTCAQARDAGARDDKSTYNLHIQTFDKFDIYYVVQTLRDLFERSFVWSLDDIIEIIHDSEIHISKEAIYTALNYIVENKTIFSDMYNRDGYIINRGPYYIFNQIDIDVNSSIYAKMLDFSKDKTKYTLGEYTKIKLDRDIFVKREDKPKVQETVPLTNEDIRYNDAIVKTQSLFGTYRQRGTITEPYGPRDNKFRIVDLRKLADTDADAEADGDKRKTISGMWIGSYKKPQLVEIANYLGIRTKVKLQDYDKDEMGKIIERELIRRKAVLR
jgi:superfamily II DNA or RNA helicase